MPHFQIHHFGSQKPLAICASVEAVDQALVDHDVDAARILIALEFPLQASVTRAPHDEEIVYVKILSVARRFQRLSGGDVDPGKIGVSCSSRGGDVVPVDTININFREADDLTDRGMVWVYGGSEANAQLTLYPRRIVERGLRPSDIVCDALSELFDRLLLPFLPKISTFPLR